MEAILIVLAAAFVVSLLPALWLTGRAYFRFRGKKIVQCPKTGTPAAITIEPLRAAVGSVVGGQPDFKLVTCSYGNDRSDCGEACLEQIAAEPEPARSKAS